MINAETGQVPDQRFHISGNPNDDYSTSGVFHSLAPSPNCIFVARVILRFYQSSDTGFQNSSDERLIHGPRSRRR
jgi:hypothetical protein